MDKRGFIPSHGGYENLVAYQKSVIVYDATVEFCARHLQKRDRTYDQMVQAARSGKQNIVEGSMASAVSRKTEIRLTNVARASLEELLEDYRDFLRTRNAPLWSKDSKEARYVRQLSRQATPGRREYGTNETYGTYGTHENHKTPASDVGKTTSEKHNIHATDEKHGRQDFQASHTLQQTHTSHPSHLSHSPYDTFRPFIVTRPSEVAANIIICLIHQTNYLLDQQIRHLEKAFIEQGGLSEAMTRARLAERDTRYRGTPKHQD